MKTQESNLAKVKRFLRYTNTAHFVEFLTNEQPDLLKFYTILLEEVFILENENSVFISLQLHYNDLKDERWKNDFKELLDEMREG